MRPFACASAQDPQTLRSLITQMKPSQAAGHPHWVHTKYTRVVEQGCQELHDPTEFAGTGVGLATAKRIVLGHKGEVWAKGVVNGGAEIFFRLPDSPKSIDR